MRIGGRRAAMSKKQRIVAIGGGNPPDPPYPYKPSNGRHFCIMTAVAGLAGLELKLRKFGQEIGPSSTDRLAEYWEERVGPIPEFLDRTRPRLRPPTISSGPDDDLGDLA
jgi:hypothetical protein